MDSVLSVAAAAATAAIPAQSFEHKISQRIGQTRWIGDRDDYRSITGADEVDASNQLQPRNMWTNVQ